MNNLIIGNNSEIEYILDSVVIDPSIKGSKREARIIHERFVKAGKLGQGAAHALRKEATNMFLTNGFLELEVEYDNDPTQKLQFGDFHSWLNYAIEKTGLAVDTLSSTLNSLIENIIDPVSKSLVLNPDTDQPYSIEDILSLPEGNSQKIASGARALLRDDKRTDEQKREILSEIISVAKTSTTEDLVELLRGLNLSFKRTPDLEVSMAYVDDKIVYQIIVDDKQDTQVQLALRGRASLRTKSIDDLVNDLKQFIHQSSNEDEVNEDEFNGFIGKIK